MTNDISQSFDAIFEKAVAKGEVKKNNPKYKRVFKNGKMVYVLVNHEDQQHHQKEISHEEFKHLHEKGDVELHFDEVPEVHSEDDLEFLNFISEANKREIKSALKKIAFYDKTIKLARSLGRTDTVSAHTQSAQNLREVIKRIVERSYNNKNIIQVVNADIVQSLKDKGCEVELPRQSVIDDSFDFINQNFSGFDMENLVDELKDTIEKQKQSLPELQGWDPVIKIRIHDRGFFVGVEREGAAVNDKFGFKKNFDVKCKRSFSVNNGQSSVYHSYFEIGDGLKGVGFAKNLMKNFYKQYLSSNIKSIGVTANLTSIKPVNGANTWGKWGFQMSWSDANSILSNSSLSYAVGKTYEVEKAYITHDNKDEVYRTYTNLNGEKVSELIDPEHVKETKKSDDGQYCSLVTRTYKFTPEDAIAIKSVLDKQRESGSPNFRVKELYDKCHKDAVLAIMQNQSWSGVVDLTSENQRKDFQDNLFRVYNSNNGTINNV